MVCGGYEGNQYYNHYSRYNNYMKQIKKDQYKRQKTPKMIETIKFLWCCGCNNGIHTVHLLNLEYEWIDIYFLEWACHPCLFNQKHRKVEMTINPINGHPLSELAKYVNEVPIVQFCWYP